MTNTFTTTGATTHSTSVNGLTNGGSYSYSVRCIDGDGHANADDFAISFSVVGSAAATSTFAGVESPLSGGGAWDSPGSWADLQTNNGAFTTGVNAMGRRVAPLAAADQYSQVIYDRDPGASSWVGVATRVQSGGDGSGYLAIAFNGEVQLYRADDMGSLNFTLLASAAAPIGNAPRRLRLESEGDTHRVYFNGVLLITHQATGIVYGAGQPAIAASVFGGPQVKILSYEGGTLDAPGLAIGDTVVTEGNSGTANASVTVLLSRLSSQTVTVQFATANGGATAPQDFTSTSGTLTFAPGVTTQTISVPVVGDLFDEDDETVLVNLFGSGNATIAKSQGILTIADDDATPSLAINSPGITEGNAGTTNLVFTVTLSAPSNKQVTVNYGTGNGTATAPADFTTTSGVLTFAPGNTSAQISVPVVGDVVDEDDETLTVTLSGASNASIATPQGIGTITDNDATPTVSINSASLNEGNSGTQNLTFTVTLSVASGRAVTVGYNTANGSATAPADYTATSGTLTFNPGTTSQQFTVTVAGDVLDEDNETFTVNLSNPTNATLGTAQGTGTINDNDNAPSMSINSPTVNEGNSGTTNAAFTVTLSAASGRTITVNYATGNGSATAPADYTAASGTLTFNPGTTSLQVPVAVAGDLLDEPTETFTVTLSGASNATISTSVGTASISDDDPTPSLGIADVSQNEGNSGTSTMTFTVTLSAASGRTVTVNYSTTNGSASAGNSGNADYVGASGTLTFSPGTTTQTVAIILRGDTTFESNETFTVGLSGASNANVADNQATGTIVNDDLPSLSINNVTVNETNGTSTTAQFTVTLSGASAQTVTVNFATAPNTAAAGVDYTSTSGSLSFSPGATTRTVSVTVLGDTLDEDDETYFVNLSGATNATIATAQGVGTIDDNDGTPSLSIANVSATEGDSGTKIFNFPVTLSAASGRTVTVDFATSNLTATAGTTGSADYVATSGTLTFTPGTTVMNIPVTVRGDNNFELSEVFRVNLSGASNASINDNSANGTIQNDD
jgi:hypothetical protein